ncbi:hypothetical protein AVEN_228072-1 [Araneus ventricosus]|uniref:Uncharacterized protein n=1 Tax=Araneus ventricosus TaxID=182803 RepID=A0A4Y2F750_ARAVE|nr:hypothetical protein AVEN_228072-1 [Araneus ventricosus]
MTFDSVAKDISLSRDTEHLETDDEMSTSRASEDVVKYNISEELEEISSDVSFLSSSPPKEQRPKLKVIIPTKYKNKQNHCFFVVLQQFFAVFSLSKN